MDIILKVSNPGEQGVPAQGLPWRDAPEAVQPLPAGVIVDGKTMTSRISLALFAETYETRASAKWQEAGALAALSSGHRYGQTPAPKDSLPRLTFFAVDLHPDAAEGAKRLAQLLDFFEFLTMPWTRLGEPPLLHVTVGYRAFYARLTDVDPKIEEWMTDRPDGRGRNLPYQASLNLSFLREPDGLAVIRERPEVARARQGGNLPISTRDPNITGGQGGVVMPGVPTPPTK